MIELSENVFSSETIQKKYSMQLDWSMHTPLIQKKAFS